MKKFISLMLAVLMLLTLMACGKSNDSSTAETAATESSEEGENAEESTEETTSDLLTEIKERGYITIATEGDWAPWTYHDEEDNLVGLDVEIGQLIADGLGVNAEFKETDWDSILAGVESGRFDIACNGVDYTEERAEKYNFSEPYVYNRTVLVVRDDNTDINSYEDLAGKMTTNSPSSIYAEIAESYGAEVTYVNTLNETLALLTQGRADATINAEVSINDYLKEHPDAGLKIVYRSEGDPIVFPVRKGADTESLVAEINRILDEARADGRLSEISMKYFDLDLTTPQ